MLEQPTGGEQGQNIERALAALVSIIGRAPSPVTDSRQDPLFGSGDTLSGFSIALAKRQYRNLACEAGKPPSKNPPGRKTAIPLK